MSFKIIKKDSVTSTNEILKKRAAQNKIVTNEILWALEQTNGKGQQKRKWHSKKGENLTFSIYTKFHDLAADNFFIINSIVSLSIVKTLQHFTDDTIEIKWPNDILVNEKKIAGILIENKINNNSIIESIIGIGININQTDMKTIPNGTSLRLLTNKSNELETVLAKFLADFKEFNNTKNSTFIFKIYEKLLFRLGKKSQFIYNGESLEGEIKGVDTHGRLIVKTKNKDYAFKNGEVKWVY